ncbi:2OG-Fe(II) oxygenase family protein [Enterovibrio coralii]|uniref:Phytanoyl-CoA dioxygenase n=1 Tax=Enterovibrio coralii TaxID=294935 RepID=A0A135I4T5_9GAMM|nr:hypothetical protein [Enterovibrio coralii]KXF80460.1 hypothetical protein ATN88_22180 [Enterovibrio coralii]
MDPFHTYTALSHQELGDRLFQGELIIFSIADELAPFLNRTKQLINKHFGIPDPQKAHLALDEPTYAARASETMTAFERDPEIKSLFFSALETCGVNREENFYDRLVLRIVPCVTSYDKGRQASVKHHRDTWGSNIDSQINWWLPIFPLRKARSIALYPDYWNKKVANTTSDWSFSRYLAEKKATPSGEKIAYPSSPQALESIDEQACFTPELQPGEILTFASAHLHGSKFNLTDKFRFSVEIRTVNIHDVKHGKGAPNVDNAGNVPMYQWFKQIKDDKKLVL